MSLTTSLTVLCTDEAPLLGAAGPKAVKASNEMAPVTVGVTGPRRTDRPSGVH